MAAEPSVVDRLQQAVETAGASAGLFTDRAVLDATVPSWPFQVHGGGRVSAELRGWYSYPGRFESVRREPLPDGELVEFTLRRQESAEPHLCHQAHLLRIAGDRIAQGTAFCGGRWGASLQAQMAAGSG